MLVMKCLLFCDLCIFLLTFYTIATIFEKSTQGRFQYPVVNPIGTMFGLRNTSLSCWHGSIGDAQAYSHCPRLSFRKQLRSYSM